MASGEKTMRSRNVRLTAAMDVSVEDNAEQQPPSRPRDGVFNRRNMLVAGSLFVVALCLLTLMSRVAGADPTKPSTGPHFVYQAWSLLHGRWNIDLTPASYVDIIVLHGKNYIVVPPFPAFLFLPFVAIWGLQTSDVLITLCIAACNLSVLFLLLEQLRASGLTKRTWLENVVISLFFSLGTSLLGLSIGGEMWFTAQILGLGCTLLSLLFAFRRHYVIATLLLGCAFFCRGTLALGFPFLFYLAWRDGGTRQPLVDFLHSLRARQPDWASIPWRRFASMGAVVLVVIGLYFVHNYLLFGNPLESGYNILNAQWYPYIDSLFSLRYVPSNFVADFLNTPHIIFQGPFDRHPAIDMLNGNFSSRDQVNNGGGVGISVFVTTPLFILLFCRNRQRHPLRMALWLTIGVMIAVSLTYYATGWWQFGARYLVDAYPYAFILMAINEVEVDWRYVALGLLGLVVNIMGAIQYWTIAYLHGRFIPHL